MNMQIRIAELIEPNRPDMSSITHDLSARANILCSLVDRAFENMRIAEDIHMIALRAESGMDAVAYMADQLLQSIRHLQETHESRGWVLAD